MRSAFLVWLLPTIAAADPKAAPKEVNLLQSAPTTVAVSSTVDNAAIVPEHLVDGKLDTAWNSRTGDLAHAWIAVRVPVDAHVSKLKLTVGFAKGDYFTQNYRIDRVHITHDGKDLGYRTLDLNNRGLQELAIDDTGGDYTIEIIHATPGSKPSWCEIAISELEVWGTVKRPAPAKPTVRIGSLDLDCARLLFPRRKVNKIAEDDYVLETSSTRLGPNLVACNVRHGSLSSRGSTVEVAFASLAPVKLRARLDPILVTNEDNASEGTAHTETVAVTPFALTDSEIAAHVERASAQLDMGGGSGEATTQLYRITGTEAVAVLEFHSQWSRGESEDTLRCELARGAARKPLPDLDLTCTKVEGRWHHEDPRGDGLFETPTTEHYRFTDGSYSKL
jgi:hypothetical protein